MGSRCMWSQCTGRRRRKKILPQMQIYIDSGVTVPQYLVLRMLPVPRVGWLLEVRTRSCKGKSFTEDPSWQRRRRQKRRNTNRLRDDTRKGQRIKGASQEMFLRGFFLRDA